MGFMKRVKKALRKLYAETPKTEPASPMLALYILMRNDMDSMNAGKAVAQGSHAANQMVFEANNYFVETPEQAAQFEKIKTMVGLWSIEARGFGTCIVLGASEREMKSAVEKAKAAGHHAGITHDPTYPLRDGKSLFFIPVDTCAYIFGYKHELKDIIGEFSLMP